MMRFETMSLSMLLTIMSVAAYTPTEKKLGLHGVNKVLQLDNGVGRDISGRRGDSLSVLDVIDSNRRAGSDRRSSAVSELIRSSSFQNSAGIASNDGINRNCHYECGVDKLCNLGQKCVRDGCDSYCVQVSSRSIIGESGLSGSIRRGNTVSKIIRGSSSDISRLSSIDGSKCSYQCGENKLCAPGHKCIHEGCNSYCVQLSSGSLIGSGQSLTGRVGLSNNDHLETIGSSDSMSGHIGSDILDAISAKRSVINALDTITSRRSGMDALDTISSGRGGSVGSSGSRIVSQSVVGDLSNCRKLCHTDSDCAPTKYCTTVDCHRICRRRPSKGYSG
ncbi:Hypothetical predicted protein [Mytilus galloprovincialis]|uniref:WAP domain-containing protein n=1 Tax=Mytilus galloprovincialis TaxID=29158 RepID=A0A8B6FLC9_MYTGA|nr:Hypothetical predicted protein [Mytilus galloprovincialis]VDI54517.1 Hypothetical predicted protein [Mytilus galloprovincialis]